LRHGRFTTGQRPGQRLGEYLREPKHAQAGRDGDPGRLHTFGDRGGAVPGAEPPRRPASRAVGEDVAEPHGHGEDSAAEG
jgi:hypothetical protein